MKYKKDNLEVVNNFIEDDFVEFIQDYFSIKINSNQYDSDKENFKNGYSFYGDPLIETILNNGCEFVSKFTEIKLFPTFTVTNMFMKDDIYTKPINDSCEISALLFLGSSKNKKVNTETTIKLKNKNDISLSIGDLLIYNAKKVKFIENSIDEDWFLQSTLNFVDSEGPYKNNIYDNRPYLGFSITSKFEPDK